MENKTDCGQKCFELQDTEYALAVEKENNQKLETEVKNLKDQIEKLEAESSSKDECIDNLEYQLKDAGGELELWQRENAELKKQNALLYEQEKEKIKLIEKMKCCENCKWYKDNDCIGDIVCTDNDWNGWELAE